jgi:hypothetical protein
MDAGLRPPFCIFDAGHLEKCSAETALRAEMALRALTVDCYQVLQAEHVTTLRVVTRPGISTNYRVHHCVANKKHYNAN